MKSIEKVFELQIDEKPNGCVIRLNDEKGCVLRICGVPKPLIFKGLGEGELREFIDIPFKTSSFQRAMMAVEVMEEFAKENNVAIITATQKPKNLTLSKLGERLKKK